MLFILLLLGLSILFTLGIAVAANAGWLEPDSCCGKECDTSRKNKPKCPDDCGD